MLRNQIALLAIAIAPCHALAAAPGTTPEPAPVSLFDGRTLDGWKIVNGSAKYRVEEGAIVGTADPGCKTNTFLRTEKSYGDFRLELDARLDVPGNSGIQFRSRQKPGNDGRVFGYQCEIDPSPRAWSAGLYDEGRRGWLASLQARPEARMAFKADGWNHFVIEARGPSIKTWLNGIPCVDVIDVADLDGFIALQVHAGAAGQIRWKDIRLVELGRPAWSPAWDGKSLQGWIVVGGTRWSITEDAIRGVSSPSQADNGLILLPSTYGDVALRLKFRAEKGDGGVAFRCVAAGGGDPTIKGLLARVANDKDAGGLSDLDGRAWLARPEPALLRKQLRPGDWNELAVVALGDRLAVFVNGLQTADVRRPDGPRVGKLALTAHAEQIGDVRFKDVEVLPLSPVVNDRAMLHGEIRSLRYQMD